MKPKLPNTDLQSEFRLSHQITAAIAATTTVNLGTLPKRARIDRVEFVFGGAVTEHADNFYVLDVKAGSTQVAAYSFDADADGTVADDTVTAMTLAADDADRVVAAGTALKFAATKTASAANLPAVGRINIFGRYI